MNFLTEFFKILLQIKFLKVLKQKSHMSLKPNPRVKFPRLKIPLQI